MARAWPLRGTSMMQCGKSATDGARRTAETEQDCGATIKVRVRAQIAPCGPPPAKGKSLRTVAQSPPVAFCAPRNAALAAGVATLVPCRRSPCPSVNFQLRQRVDAARRRVRGSCPLADIQRATLDKSSPWRWPIARNVRPDTQARSSFPIRPWITVRKDREASFDNFLLQPEGLKCHVVTDLHDVCA